MQQISAHFPILSLMVALPFLAALALWLIKPLKPFARPFGLAISAIVLLAGIYVLVGFDYSQAGAYQYAETYRWLPAIGASWALGINGLGLAMVGLSAVLVLIVLIASARDEYAAPRALLQTNQVDSVAGIDDESTPKALPYDSAGYVALILASEAFMVLIFAARDVFLFYLAFEAMLVPLYFLIGHYGKGKRAKVAAMKFLLFSLAGGLVMLVGVVGLWAASPLRSAADSSGDQIFLLENLVGKLQLSPSTETWLFLSFFIAFAIKAPMVPLHTWLADAAENARPGTSALLVGVLDKIGTFGMITLCLTIFPQASKQMALPIMILAVISVIWGSLAALAQKDLMRLISFTSVAHFGLMILGIYGGNSVAMTGAMVYMVAHGLSITGMFVIGGFLTERGQSQEIESYGGMQQVTPLLAGGFLICGLSAIALPGLSGFVPELMVFLGTFKVATWAAVCCLVGVVAGAVYVLLPYQKIFTGDVAASRRNLKDLNRRERWGVMAPLIVLMLIMGLYPQPLVEPLSQVSDTTSQVAVAQVVTEGTQK